MNEGKESRSELIITDGNQAELLELEEELFRKMSFPIMPLILRCLASGDPEDAVQYPLVSRLGWPLSPICRFGNRPAFTPIRRLSVRTVRLLLPWFGSLSYELYSAFVRLLLSLYLLHLHISSACAQINAFRSTH